MLKIGLYLLAALVVSLTASAPASAFSYLIEGKTFAGTETVASNGGNAVLKSAGLKVTCGVALGTGSIKANGKGTAETNFTDCTVNEPINCIVEEPIKVSTENELSLVGGILSKKYKPFGGGTVFTTLHFLNQVGKICPLSEIQVTGSATGLILGGEESKKEGEVSFTNTSGSELEAGGATAKFTFIEKIELSGAGKNENWSAMME